MNRDFSRRNLLYTVGAASTSMLAGCNSESSEDTTASTETTAGSEPSATTTREGVVVESASVVTTELTRGDTLRVTVTLTNAGDGSASADLPLSLGDATITTETVELAGGGRQTVELAGPADSTGTRPVFVSDERIGEVVVRAERTESVRPVGAHYYPWYGSPLHDWRGGEWSLESPSTPVLGNYNSADPDVVEQHIDWCRRAGISWLNVSWWGPYSGHDDRIQEDILAHPRADELQWSILYETVGRIGSDRVQMDTPDVRERFADDLAYLAETYFQRDSYMHIDDRPVLYVWVSQVFGGDVEAAYTAAVEEAGVDPYLIVDVPFGTGLDAYPMVGVADAVNSYLPYDPSGQTADEFVSSLESGYRTWYRAADALDVDLLPTAMPGFDDTELTHDPRNNVPLSPTPDLYERAADVARRYADGPVLVTSFNEWYEDTAVEPSEDHGTAYLDRTADRLATADRQQPQFDRETFTLRFEDTVSESSMNPDVENGRALTLMLHRLRVLDADGDAVVDADVGADADSVRFVLGSYGPERSGEDTWRWLGGRTETLVAVPSLPAAGQVELVGSGAKELSVALSVNGDVQSEATVPGDMATTVLPF